MVEGIEVRFFGKLTYYAVSIYVLFVLGLLIVCRKRCKSRKEQQHSGSNKEKKVDNQSKSEKEEMGLSASTSNNDKEEENFLRRRKGKPEKLATFEDGGGEATVTNIHAANGQVIVDKSYEIINSTESLNVNLESRKHEDISILSEEIGRIPKISESCHGVSEPESAMGIVTSASDDNKNTIGEVIRADVEVKRVDFEEMGRSEFEQSLSLTASNFSSYKDDQTCEDGATQHGNIEVRNEFAKEREVCSNKVSHDHVDKEVSASVDQLIEKKDSLNSFANKTALAIVNDVLFDLKNRHLKTAKDLTQRDENTTVSPKVYEHTNDDFNGDRRISESVKEQMIDYADRLAKGILFGFDENGSALPCSSPNGKQVPVKASEGLSLGFCQAIASDVCRDASKSARGLEVLSEKMSKSILNAALDKCTKLPADTNNQQKPLDTRSNLKAEGHRRKIFCSSENIFDDDVEESQEDVQSFSTDVGKGIMNNVINDVRQKFEKDYDGHTHVNGDHEHIVLRPDILINNEDINSFEDGRVDGNVDKHGGIDSMSHSDNDDEDDDEDSYYSDESDKEVEPPVIIRNKNTLRLKMHSDRPLSGYAEQLMQFLTDEDEDLEMFESDEEFDAVLGKMEEKYRDDEELCTKIQRRRKLSESKRKSESSDMSKCTERNRNVSLERLSDGDSRERITSTLSESSFISNTDTDDALRGVFSDDQPLSPGPGKFDLKTTVVVDTGCGTLKAGLAGEIAPSHVLPSVIGVPRRFSLDVSKMTRGYYVGDDAIMHAGMLQLDHPMKKIVTNWSDVYSLLEYVLEDALQINIRDHPILLTEIGLMPKQHREKLTEIMFERFNAQAFFLANQGPLSLYSMGLTSGLCVNSGYCTTQSIPVYEGHSLPYCTRQLDIGGEQVTNHLGRLLLSEKGLAFSSSSEKFLLSDMMERYCYVAEDLKKEKVRLKKQYDDIRKIYELPDGQLIDLDVERFESSEILYEPELIGLEQKPLHEMIIDSIAGSDQDLKPVLMNNTIVTGGTTLLQGFTKRLGSELIALESQTGHIKLKNASNPVTATWNGASVISSLSTFSQQCITTDQYAEYGSQIVHMKCF